MREPYDAIVIGVGGMGSAALYQLARRGKRVLGIDRFDIPNTMGSSHGVNRIIRLAYFEHPTYVPLLRRAYELWRQVETEFDEQLLYITGSLDVGRPGSQVLDGSLQSCKAHGLAHEFLSTEEVVARFPAYKLPEGFKAVWQPDGGFVLSERAIVAHVTQAQAAGAEVRRNEAVVAWEVDGNGIVAVATDRGAYRAERLILTAGAWAPDLIEELVGYAVPERQALGWFEPLEPELFHIDRFPVFNFTVDEGHFYGLPVFGVPGFKLGRYHHLEEVVDPDTMDREPNERDERVLRDFIARYFPAANGPVADMKTCMFTNTEDEHFVIDVHPEHPQVAIAAGFSGHGYKFASVVGEILADLAERGTTGHDISRFAIGRF
ncbi:MAG: N-methyl-L-tryptophan oxidase [Gemmatimonadetes bacterium]|nr:N-methyl-L-tryptophan oxidase [Gemmatimonadota bacterium]